ncbi:MAG: thioredoxin family protein [Phycisphaeraceae bacterium]|nr:thioredoxin family protein [Phycisphaeraceae bacterium]
MKTYQKIGIVVILLTIVTAVIVAKNQQKSSVIASPSIVAPLTPPSNSNPESLPASTPLPRLVDLGASRCTPCKMMAPILEELKRELTGKLDVQFIDVWQNPEAGRQYGIHMIPTQIFYDASGKELARHEGFISRQDILNRWAALGVSLVEPAPPGK